MKKYSLINLYKTPFKGPIFVVDTSDSLEELQAIAEEHDEVVLNVEDERGRWYSRNLNRPVKTFRAR